MRRLIDALESANEGGTPTRDTIAIMAALAIWLLSFGALWDILIKHMTPSNAGELAAFLAIVPTVLAWLAIVIISEIKKWY